MNKHTPEPWSIGTSRITSLSICAIDSDGNEAIIASPNFNFSNHHENARRIVTCVNACAGMDDPAAEIAELKRQRDELLAAMKTIANSEEFHGDSFICDFDSLQSVARASIAKAKGGAS